MLLRRVTSIAVFTVCAILVCPVRAHGPDSDHPHGDAVANPSLPAALILPNYEGPKPWSDKPVLNDPARFQIAIMSDNTGGHRPGIWMDAVRKLNMLRPEFVVSVGDLIEGYSEDRAEIEVQWKEFTGFIDQMEMRFFFVTGNHDVTNPLMHEIWREKFGREWYSFDYKGVHFVCLCSEDPKDRIGDAQLNWLEQDLAEHADARWTLAFLHKPLWIYAEQEMAAGNGDPTNWKQVERLLADRPHTVFAGHVHRYVAYERNGQNYYSLATTGGGSRLRGNEYGEFDHVTWLTMEPDGPHLANLRLDGILPPDVVTESSIERFGKFLEGTVVEVAPILIDNDSGFGEGEVHVRLRNQFDEPVTLTGSIDGLPLRGLTVDPAEIALAADPGKTTEQSIRVRFEKPIEFPSLAQTTLTAKIATTGESPLRAERLAPVVIDRRFICPQIAKIPDVDGRIGDLPGLMIRFPDRPSVFGNAATWTGPNDSTAEFSTACDESHLYVAVRVTDENVLVGDDRVELLIDPRPVDVRRAESRLEEGTLSIVASAPDGAETPVDVVLRDMESGEQDATAITAVGSKTDSGYDLELAIPLDVIQTAQGDDWHSVQMNVVVHDADEKEQPPAQVPWRGGKTVYENNVGFGYIVREK
ncbi:MAG: metallophosphoesterase [Pirellulales bacterium]